MKCSVVFSQSPGDRGFCGQSPLDLHSTMEDDQRIHKNVFFTFSSHSLPLDLDPKVSDHERTALMKC